MANSTAIEITIDKRIKRAVDSRLENSTAAGKARRFEGELAASVAYDARSKRLQIELASGVGFRIPVARIQGLVDVPASIIRTVRIEGRGYGLYWPTLDLDLAVPDLVAGCLGSRTWMTALARQGGKAATAAKRRASRANGKKGGRPRKGRSRAGVPSG